MNKVILSVLFALLALQAVDCQIVGTIIWIVAGIINTCIRVIIYFTVDGIQEIYRSQNMTLNLQNLNNTLRWYQGNYSNGLRDYNYSVTSMIFATIKPSAVTNLNQLSTFNAQFASHQNRFNSTSFGAYSNASAFINLVSTNGSTQVNGAAQIFANVYVTRNGTVYNCTVHYNTSLDAVANYTRASNNCSATALEQIRIANRNAAIVLNSTAINYRNIISSVDSCYRSCCMNTFGILDFDLYGTNCTNNAFYFGDFFFGASRVRCIVNCLNQTNSYFNGNITAIKTAYDTAITQLNTTYNAILTEYKNCIESNTTIYKNAIANAQVLWEDCIAITITTTTTEAPTAAP